MYGIGDILASIVGVIGHKNNEYSIDNGEIYR